MTRESCAYCGRPIPDGVGERIGLIRFCSKADIVEWFSLPQHDRRHVLRRDFGAERRTA